MYYDYIDPARGKEEVKVQKQKQKKQTGDVYE